MLSLFSLKSVGGKGKRATFRTFGSLPGYQVNKPEPLRPHSRNEGFLYLHLGAVSNQGIKFIVFLGVFVAEPEAVPKVSKYF